MKKVRTILFRGFLILVTLGGLLLGLGYVSGGFEDLKDIAKSVKVSKTFDSVTSLDLDLTVRDVVIEESKDNKAHLTYYQNGRYGQQVTVTQQAGLLKLSEKEPKAKITSLLGLFGTWMERDGVEYWNIRLALPKGTTLSAVKGQMQMGVLEVTNQTIKQIDFQGSGTFKSSRLEGGRISDSIRGFGISFVDSYLKNVAVSSSWNDIDLKNTTLEASPFSLGSADLSGENLTVLGAVELTSNQGNVYLQLKSDQKDKVSLDLTVADGQLEVDKDLAQGKTVKQADDDSKTFVKNTLDSSNKLDINLQEGDLTLK